MATTLEKLEKRVAALERELAALRPRPQPAPTTGRFGDDIPMIREARAMQPLLDTITAKVFAEMGITGEPEMSIQELRRSMEEHGVKPEENSASREIIAMREE
jgi:hypothetical protein